LACKDLYLAHQLGREFAVPLELAGLVEQTFIRARAQYGGSAWSSQVVKPLEDALGTDLRAAGFPDVLTNQLAYLTPCQIYGDDSRRVYRRIKTSLTQLFRK
jgi:hypothetical protein